jgi:hypothetical protein
MEAPEADGSQCHVVAIVENTSKGENVWITTEMVGSRSDSATGHVPYSN